MLAYRTSVTVVCGRKGDFGWRGGIAYTSPTLKQYPAESGEMSEEVLELGGKRCKFGAIEI
jgi:hypothetical protein